jgi:heme A synthase
MSSIMTKKFWGYAGERAIKTFAQTLVAFAGVDAMTGNTISFVTIDLVNALAVAATAAIVSVLTSVVNQK